MTLRASLLREVLNPTVSVGRRVELCCELAQEFENKGEYEEARELLSGLWPDIGQRPEVAELDQDTAAEVALAIFQEMGDRLAIVEEPTITGRKLSEEVRALEHKLIKHALESAGGSLTYAARNLGMSYQALTYMLETRHKDLLPDRSPARRRQRK